MYNSFKVLVLTFNDECQISRLLEDLSLVEQVIIVDSNSTDKTLEICEEFGVKVFTHKFINQAESCNWAIENIFKESDWIFRLDSDERVSKALLDEISSLTIKDEPIVGYVNREMTWMGKKLKYSALRPHFIGRLFKVGYAKYEDVTEEHLLHDCTSIRLTETFYEDNKKNDIFYFLEKHMATGIGEVQEYNKNKRVSEGILFSDLAHLRTRWFKVNVYNRIPMFIRPAGYFLYRYFFKLGFLDGKAGFSFCFFQAFFYRMLIDQRLFEIENPQYYGGKK